MTIYTAKTFEKLDREAKLAAFEAAGLRAYGSARFGAEFSSQSGWAAKTIANWRAKSGDVPVQAVLLLQEWSGGKTTQAIMIEAFKDVARDLAGVSRTLNSAANAVSVNLAASADGPPADTASDDAVAADVSRL
jgi:hypothetical protein